MKRLLSHTVIMTIAGAFLAGAFITLSTPANAEELSSMTRGGKLYDKWFKVVGADKPSKTHPAWPASNTKKKGNATHRCKSCHGWDGLGKDGGYASGSYKTGIKGVNGMWGADTAKIIAVMKDKTHGYSGKMDDDDFQDIANFVSKGQIDFRKYIDYKTKKPKGNAAKGAGYFNTVCAGCHRKDGTRPKDMDKTLAKQMGNPFEVLHKIQNGHPGEPMPSLRAFDPQVGADIMAHLLTLPMKK